MIQDAVNYFILQHTQLRNSYEVAWGLWLLKALDLKLYDECNKHVSNFDNPIVAILAMDIEEQALTETRLDRTIWKQHMDEDQALFGENWLLVYESNQRNWLPSKTKNLIVGDSFFEELQKQSVSFYDSSFLKKTSIDGKNTGSETAQ